MLTVQPGPVRFPGMADAIASAMDCQRAFSWLRGPNVGNVQMGVYLRHSQATYRNAMQRQCGIVARDACGYADEAATLEFIARYEKAFLFA